MLSPRIHANTWLPAAVALTGGALRCLRRHGSVGSDLSRALARGAPLSSCGIVRTTSRSNPMPMSTAAWKARCAGHVRHNIAPEPQVCSRYTASARLAGFSIVKGHFSASSAAFASPSPPPAASLPSTSFLDASFSAASRLSEPDAPAAPPAFASAFLRARSCAFFVVESTAVGSFAACTREMAI
jgi:hypothetical protein